MVKNKLKCVRTLYCTVCVCVWYRERKSERAMRYCSHHRTSTNNGRTRGNCDEWTKRGIASRSSYLWYHWSFTFNNNKNEQICAFTTIRAVMYSCGFRFQGVCGRMVNTILSSEHRLTFPMETGMVSLRFSGVCSTSFGHRFSKKIVERTLSMDFTQRNTGFSTSDNVTSVYSDSGAYFSSVKILTKFSTHQDTN